MYEQLEAKEWASLFQANAFVCTVMRSKKSVLHEFYNMPLARHKGVRATMAELQNSYFWPCIRTDVE